METIHIHRWPKPPSDPNAPGADDPLEELDASWFDSQPNLSTPPEDDGYHQFGGSLADGTWLEVRISNDLVRQLLEQQNQQPDAFSPALLEEEMEKLQIDPATREVLRQREPMARGFLSHIPGVQQK